MLGNLRILRSTVDGIASELQRCSESELRGKTEEFRRHLGSGASLEDLLPEALAVACEAARRVTGSSCGGVPLMAGAAMSQGLAAGVKDGEGKGIAAVLAAYCLALPRDGAHLVTLDDIPAQRDAALGDAILGKLGFDVGCVLPSMTSAGRREAYLADVTYGSYAEFGYDYLRDNLARCKHSAL